MLPISYTTRNSLFPAISLFDSFFDDVLKELPASSDLIPSLNLREDEKSLYVSVELPGINKEDVDISIKENVLLVKGEKRHEGEHKKEDYTRIERAYGAFHRAIRLPQSVDEEHVLANLKDGVLELTIPKLENDTKRISIN